MRCSTGPNGRRSTVDGTGVSTDSKLLLLRKMLLFVATFGIKPVRIKTIRHSQTAGCVIGIDGIPSTVFTKRIAAPFHQEMPK